MNKNFQSPTKSTSDRQGSTLVIVIALLGLLAFTGVVFFTFASQERAAAEYFSEAAKGEVDAPDNVWDHPLRQIISGTSNSPSDRASILRSTTRRHSMTTNLVGADLSPHSGEGVHLIMEDDPSSRETSAVPRVDMDRDGTANDEDEAGEPNNQPLLNFVDSPSVWMGNEARTSKIPAPDVDYTSPDINNMFLAYKGWAVRDNDPGNVGGIMPRYERVPIIIPSFFRPQYMKTSGSNGFGGYSTPTDINWAQSYDGFNPNTAGFAQRSFRPNPQHIAGFMPDGTTPVYRYLTAAEATSFGVTSGAFPFVPEDNKAGQPGGLNGIRGELGVWTGSAPEAYELDADPDGDGIREGIWIDTHYPVQEHVEVGGTTRLYVVMHSFTIYDLDGLIDLNVHGNLAGLDRSGNLQTIAGSGVLNSFSVSRSNQGLGPNEINPIWALRKSLAAGGLAGLGPQFSYAYGQVPNSPLEQANMEWIWLLSGRAQTGPTDIFTGRWGEAERVFNTYVNNTFQVWDLPRPGASGDAQQDLSSGVRFGGGFGASGKNGFDDNQDAFDGEIAPRLGRIRPFGTPMDYAGTGRIVDGRVTGYNPGTGALIVAGDPRIPILHHSSTSTGPERFQAFDRYSMTRDINTSNSRYVFGQNGTFDNATGDDLIANPNLDALFEDPLESVFDAEISQKAFDAVFGPQDMPALHLTDADITSAPDKPSERLVKLAPYALDKGNAPFSFYEQTTESVRSRFTTVSNSLHRFMMRSPFGADGRPGDAGVNDDGDNLTDEPDEVLATYGDSDTSHRFWEFSADTDGNDRDGDGFPDGDGFYEFPPAFGTAPTTPTTGKPYSGTDPFRAQVRRMLTMESGESRGLFGQMPLSINHILDVERNNEIPAEGTPEFLYYMQRAGMRFRPLIDHPSATEGATTTGTTVIPTNSIASPVAFPPTTPEEREFWARRDRQKLARDIYVLLYTTGGAGINDRGTPANATDDYTIDYSGVNDPSLSEGTSLYTHEQLRRMAQFAVNLVDAMDSDPVITKFEYDKNFGNGWNMDDNPYAAIAVDASLGYSEDAAVVNPAVTDKGLYPEDGLERGVVYGVEAQELAFSEVLAATSQKFPMSYSDSAQTKHADLTDDTNFLQIELQNVRPTLVDMALTGATGTGNEDFGIWQLARFDRDTTAAAPQVIIPTQRITLMEGNVSVSGGNRFTVAIAGNTSGPAAADPTGWGTADIYANYDNDPGLTFELVAPDISAPSLTAGGTAAVPRCDLDLIYAAQNTRWLNAGNNRTNLGQFIDTLKMYQGNSSFNLPAQPADYGFDLVLRRRANPNMPKLPLAENPWIEMDRQRVTFRNIFQDNSLTMAMDLHLEAAPSIERSEPLDGTSRQQYPAMHGGDPAPQPYRFNTIGSEMNVATSVAGGSFDLMQTHYDREYASSAELLQLPLVGPNLLTQRMNRIRYAPYRQVFDAPGGATPSGTIRTENISSAEAMLLQPDFPGDPAVTSIPINTARDNRWYRLFQFVEVPSRVHRMLGNYLTLQRVPGKLNVNMIRHREVLAGLIDNPLFADVAPLFDLAPPNNNSSNNEEDSPFMTSTASAGNRDAWFDLIKDRDGRPMNSFNPATAAVASFWLPATAHANPFRSYAFQGSNVAQDNGFEHTPLRHLLQDRDDNSDGYPDSGVGFNNDGTAKGLTPGSGTADVAETNRHWLEVGSATYHQFPGNMDESADGSEERRFSAVSQRHQVLSKILNNTTTVSNCFIVYGVAAYFEAYEEPTTGLIRVGGRYDLDPTDGLGNDEQRAVFIIDRTEAFNAYDPGTGDFDWKRLVKDQVIIK